MTEYAILNAYSVRSTGFYNGKAGFSLCFFEVAGFLKDTDIESHASELLYESLLSKNNDIGFENGLAGIGYVLLYLMENQFIEADFDDLFGENMEKIFSGIKNISGNKMETRMLPVVYLLNRQECCWKNHQMSDDILSLIRKNEEALIKGFSQMISPDNKILALKLLQFYCLFLKVIRQYPDDYFPDKLFEAYSNLYNNNRIASSYEIGHYMKNITLSAGKASFSDVIERNINDGLQSIHPALLSLSQRINLAYMLRQNIHSGTNEFIRELEKPFSNDLSEKEIEKDIVGSINKFSYCPGFESGIVRLILYLIFLENKQLPETHSRFNHIFLL